MSRQPINTIPVPDIDALRASGSVPQWFGLGFIQLDMPNRQRLHFWVDDWPQVDPEMQQWHDHRYDFTSHVLKGEVFNRRALVGPLSAAPFEGCMELMAVHCQPAQSRLPALLGYCQMHEGIDEQIAQEGRYFMPHDMFHVSRSSPGTITVLDRGPQVRDVARVVQPVGHGHACPFAVTFSAHECWERIQSILAV